LEETDWNLKQASEMLDIARGTLYSKMKKYNIEKPGDGGK
jgi:transcriptional regulator of acetoin/glycerol metabolism